MTFGHMPRKDLQIWESDQAAHRSLGFRVEGASGEALRGGSWVVGLG